MMLFGNKKPVPPAAGTDTGTGAAPTGAAADVIFDVGTVDFEDRVMAASMSVPVLVDFWAAWCGPCRQLMPVLEAEVQAAGGRVKLAKVNIDENPELAQALRVQSVPTVFAFVGGQPVTAFTGARPPSEIKALIAQLVKMGAPGEGPPDLDIPAALAAAAQALADGQAQQAQQIYLGILAHDAMSAEAHAGLVRAHIAAGDLVAARFALQDVPPALAPAAPIAAAATALELAENAPDAGALAALAAAAQKNPDDLQARFDYGAALFAAGRHAAAIDEMVAIIVKDRAWEEEKARKELLRFFEAMGPADPETAAGRRKLSAVLFS